MSKCRACLLALAAGLALSACRNKAVTQSPPPPPAAPPVTAAPAPPKPVSTELPPHEGLPNFHLVEPGIYRGGAPTAAGLRSLKAMGVKTIIDLRIEVARKKEKAEAEAMGFQMVNLPMGREAPTKAQVKTFLDTLGDASRQPIYVHCQHGSDRTGCMVGLYRVTVQGWSFDKTFAEMRKYDFNQKFTELRDTVRKAAKP